MFYSSVRSNNSGVKLGAVNVMGELNSVGMVHVNDQQVGDHTRVSGRSKYIRFSFFKNNHYRYLIFLFCFVVCYKLEF